MARHSNVGRKKEEKCNMRHLIACATVSSKQSEDSAVRFVLKQQS